MAAIRHNLQREVFKPSEERLYAVVNVTKAGKKKKASFLCAAVTIDKPETVSIYQVKKTDKDTFKKKASWRFRDLKIIDGKDATKETPEFDLHFEKTYKWVASSYAEKLNFIIGLSKRVFTLVIVGEHSHIPMKVSQVFDILLSELEPVCTSEQEFVQKFFDLAIDEFDTPDVSSSGSDASDGAFLSKSNSGNTMYMLVRIGQYVITNQLTCAPVSYLSQQLGNCLITVKRLFDKFIEFVEISEGIFKNAERRTDLDKAYIQLTRVVLDHVERVAMENLKNPKAVVMLENYHHLFRVLSRLKISCLEKEKREAKQKYGVSLDEYVKDMMGRPMEKVSIFFEGVQEKIAAGVKAEEVGYQLAFSKQELRKCIKEYPSKEVTIITFVEL
ncbi:hypothetical protein QZH41_004483 [Actinostola sp. cb2023]|nr:hypothetical protein QZH41_004483 [Actinostola sp. cb2023]